jgi:chemotaxis protein CheD
MPEAPTNVGIAGIRTATDPEVLSAHGLGSCVAVVLYDPVRKVGGIAHPMLPSSRHHGSSANPGKFVDTAVEALVHSLEGRGSATAALRAKLVGGANMFSSLAYQAVPIGMRNAAAAREALASLGIPIVGEDLGGAQGRTIQFSLSDGKVEVRKLNQPVTVL